MREESLKLDASAVAGPIPLDARDGANGRQRPIRRLTVLLVASLTLGAMFIPRSGDAADSIYGKIVEVKSADLVVLDYGEGKYDVRIAGIVPTRDTAAAGRAKEFVSTLVLGKKVRLRFDGRNNAGEMVGQLQTDDPEIGIKDVGLELVRSGMVRRQPSYDYKYKELSAAENEARSAKRGLWATAPQPQ